MKYVVKDIQGQGPLEPHGINIRVAMGSLSLQSLVKSPDAGEWQTIESLLRSDKTFHGQYYRDEPWEVPPPADNSEPISRRRHVVDLLRIGFAVAAVGIVGGLVGYHWGHQFWLGFAFAAALAIQSGSGVVALFRRASDQKSAEMASIVAVVLVAISGGVGVSLIWSGYSRWWMVLAFGFMLVFIIVGIYQLAATDGCSQCGWNKFEYGEGHPTIDGRLALGVTVKYRRCKRCGYTTYGRPR